MSKHLLKCRDVNICTMVLAFPFRPLVACCCLLLSQVLSQLSRQGIAVRMATKKLAAEEAPDSYKDVSQVRQSGLKAAPA